MRDMNGANGANGSRGMQDTCATHVRPGAWTGFWRVTCQYRDEASGETRTHTYPQIAEMTADLAAWSARRGLVGSRRVRVEDAILQVTVEPMERAHDQWDDEDARWRATRAERQTRR